jgi:hypothetical protein
MERLVSRVEYLMHKHPERIVEFAKKVYKHNPEAIEEMLENYEQFGHITNEHKYKELVDRLKWKNGQGKGERWKVEDIKRYSRMNFENEDFTEFDFAYLVNMLYSKCSKEFSDMSFYIKLAKCFLEDDDEETKLYRGAEHHGRKHSQHDTQARYDDYDEESRRRRYRSEYDYRNEDYRYEDYRNEDARRYRREDYRNEESRRYRNESEDYRDSRYRDSKIGFR